MKTKAKKAIKKKPDYYTIGVLFLDSSMFAKVYTYKVHNRSKVLLGQELVADTPRGSQVAVVVRIDVTPQDNNSEVGYKFIERKVAKL